MQPAGKKRADKHRVTPPLWRIGVGLVLGSLLIAAGCGEKRTAVHGTVRLDGSLLNEAAIVFVPLEQACKKTGAGITDGKYEIPVTDGLLPGNYRVEIVDNPPLTMEEAGAHSGKITAARKLRRVLPPQYGHDSSLRFTLSPHAVGMPQQVDIDFHSTQPSRPKSGRPKGGRPST